MNTSGIVGVWVGREGDGGDGDQFNSFGRLKEFSLLACHLLDGKMEIVGC